METVPVLDHSKRHHRFFEEMTKIPHGSFHEKAYSDYLVAFAKSHGFRFVQDSMNNVVIYKNASPGYEDHPVTAIQAHMDMVWEKDEGWEHDFFTDELKLKIESGYLTAEHTTLGADDGTGVAYILALLDDPDAKHPPVEAIFTVQEEVGLLGAQALDKNLIKATRLISLDCGGGDSIYVSSLGGYTADLCREIHPQIMDGKAWKLVVSGLRGEYSTSYLDGAKSAIDLCRRFLIRFHEQLGISLISINGGSQGGKAAAFCEAEFMSEAEEKAVLSVYDVFSETIRKEYGFAEPGLSIRLVPAVCKKALSAEESHTILNFFQMIPAGVVEINARNPRGIGSVANLTSVQTADNEITLRCSMRAESNYKLDFLSRQLALICSQSGFIVRNENHFPAWEYDPDSDLCRILRLVFHNQTGNDLKLIEVQGGLECGIFSQFSSHMDIITMGPVGEFVHTTKERLNLRSFDEIFDVFLHFLEAL